jgi:hypothetical protein
MCAPAWSPRNHCRRLDPENVGMASTLKMLLAGSKPPRRRRRTSTSSRSPSPDVALTRKRGPSYQRQVSSQAARSQRSGARQAARSLLTGYTPPTGLDKRSVVRELARSPSLVGATFAPLSRRPTPASREAQHTQ